MTRFVEKHSDRLKPYSSRPLDTSRARAVNPVTKDAFFELLKSTIQGGEGEEPILSELIYSHNGKVFARDVTLSDTKISQSSKGEQTCKKHYSNTWWRALVPHIQPGHDEASTQSGH